MNDREAKVAALLRESADLHHMYFRLVDGDDPDWASWYAEWLVARSELPEVLGVTPVRSELVFHLVRLAREHAASGSTAAWADFYAAGIVAAQ